MVIVTLMCCCCSPGLGADAPGDLPPVVMSEALAIAAVSALLDPEFPTVGLLLAEPQGVALVLVGVGVAHVLETGVAVPLLRVRPQLPGDKVPSILIYF